MSSLKSFRGTAWFAALSLALFGFACGGGSGTGTTGEAAVIKIDGSSTVFPVTEAVAEEFQKEMGGRVKVTVGISGTAVAQAALSVQLSL